MQIGNNSRKGGRYNKQRGTEKEEINIRTEEGTKLYCSFSYTFIVKREVHKKQKGVYTKTIIRQVLIYHLLIYSRKQTT